MEFIDSIGYAVCHQIPERSLFIDGEQLPVCARDTGLYIGSLLSLLFIVTTNRRNRNAIPVMYISFSFVFFMVLLAIDGLTSYFGIRETTNGIRLATGLLVGITLPFFMYPLMIDNILSPRTDQSILSRWYELVLLLFLVAASFLLIYRYNDFLFYPIIVLITGGILLLHYLMIVTLVSFVLSHMNSAKVRKNLFITLPLSAVLLFGEMFLLHRLHHIIS
jgi:uncharacterized membrane protein